jgi:membrane peptidoglycan carboxypeptidase
MSRRQRPARELPVETDDSWRPALRPSRLPAWVPRPLRITLRVLTKLAIWGVIIFVLVTTFYLCLSFRYDLTAVTAMPERSIILDTKGRELATLHGENRRLISRDEIPAEFVLALLAREDKRFFSHHGVDYFGLARATLRNLRDVSFTQGASTLTMQLARNSYDMRARSLHRKLLEIALTYRIEAHFTKDEILTCYVNRIYFGSGCHGIGEASRRYFDREASELTPTQSALLAGIIRAPHACSPLRNLPGAIRQRDEVLARMVAEEFLTAEQADEIRKTPLELVDATPVSARSGAGQAIRRHFEVLLAKQDIARGGLRIRSSIHANLQFLLETEVQSLDKNLDPSLQLAAVCVDPRDGGMLAIVGGRRPSHGTFNRALDARRDLGSVFSPFLLAALAERGIAPDPDKLISQGRKLGANETARLVKRFGFTGPFAQGDDLFRGSLGTTPLELATAVATLSNEGQRPHTFLLREISTPAGAILFSNQPTLTPALSSQAAKQALEAQFPADDTLTLTGLSPARSDAWALYFGARHALCIWIGADQPAPLPDPDRTLSRLKTSIERLSLEFTRRP